MKDMWQNQWQRVTRWGLLRTLGYYLCGVLPDKLGIKLLAVYEYAWRPSSLEPRPELTFSIVESMNGLTSRDVDRLQSYNDTTQLPLFSLYFSRGDKCAVARWENSDLACLCWLETTTCYPLNAGHRCTVFHDCVTLPDYRGRGVYPHSLTFACYSLQLTGPNKQRVFIDCSVANYASRKGIQKAGFAAIGTICSAFGRTWHWGSRKKIASGGCDAAGAR